MKKLYRTVLVAILATLSTLSAAAVGWPAAHEGVMLQNFWFYDSSKGEFGADCPTKWKNMTANVDELSTYFNLIWVPNSAKAASNPGMGYDAVYWFTNHTTSAFGTEKALREMIAAYKAKGTGIIADVVLNHRSGVSNWTNFPRETWNGETFQLGPEHICRNDEVANAPGQATPTGAYDTGENFDGSRDLDHTNATVQYNCKKYMEFLLTDLGYTGVRLDMVKGYAPQYTKIYNQYAKPKYSVGEYWDGSYDALVAWVEGTGRESAVFDYSLKYQINKAFKNNDMTQLVWLANGTTPQPAGLIHFAYQQFAVTFVENHDTHNGAGDNPFHGNIPAANAFIICSPGTPCVFLPHYQQYKTEIQKMIKARNGVGVTNTSAVNVLKTTRDCYMAEVTGKRGKLVVRIGSTNDAPSGGGYSVACSGTGYCIWTTNQGGGQQGGGDNQGGDTPSTFPAHMYLIGNVNGQNWSTTEAPEANSASNGVYTWNSITIEDVIDSTTKQPTGVGYFSFITARGGDWDEDVNPYDRYGASSKDEAISSSATVVRFIGGQNASSAYSWKAPAATYKVVLDLNKMTVTLSAPGNGGGNGGGNQDNPGGDYPANLYLVGNVNGQNWDITNAPRFDSASNGTYTWNKVVVDNPDDPTNVGYFSFITVLGSDWDSEVNQSDRYGSAVADGNVELTSSAPIVLYQAGVNASAAGSWKVAKGTYKIVANLATMTVTISEPSGVEAVEADENVPAVFYDMQGRRVDNPGRGIYIMVKGSNVSKHIIR